MQFYSGRKILVTGGNGFIASNLIEALLQAGASVRSAGRTPRPLAAPRDVEYSQVDLRERDDCRRAVDGMDCVFHLAAVGWGLHENIRNQPRLFTDNVLLNTALLDAAYQAGVERYLYTSSSAVYPAHLQEADEAAPWDAPPHPTEECFGRSKRIAEIQCQAYARYYGMKIAIVRPSNPYGPRDTFDRARSHVIPSLILKALSQGPFVVWGSGAAVRSFVYVADVVRIMMAALERHAVCDPINVASTETTSIAALARMVLDLCGRPDTEVEFDGSKPDGHPRRVLCVRRAAEILGIREYVPLREGLRRTIEWYLQNKTP